MINEFFFLVIMLLLVYPIKAMDVRTVDDHMKEVKTTRENIVRMIALYESSNEELKQELTSEIDNALKEVTCISGDNILGLLEEHEKEIKNEFDGYDSCETSDIEEHDGLDPKTQCEEFILHQRLGISLTKKCWLLRLAAFNGRTDVVKVLLKKGAQCKANRYGWTPLHYAAYNGHLEVMKVLLKDKYPICLKLRRYNNDLSFNDNIESQKKSDWIRNSIADKLGNSNPIIWLYDECREKPRLLEAHNANSCRFCENRTAYTRDFREKKINAKSLMGLSPLHCAIMNNHPDAVKCLLASPVSEVIVETDRGLVPPLHWAACNESDDIINALLDYVISVQNHKHQGWLKEHGRHNLVEVLEPLELQRINRFLFNHLVSANGGSICWLGTNSAKKLNTHRNEKGKTVLYEAVESNMTTLVKVLAEGGMDVNCVNTSLQETPLHEASARGNPEIVEILLEAGAVPVGNSEGTTPLHKVVVKALSCRQDIDAPLMRHKCVQCITKLIAARRNLVNSADNKKSTPLFRAARGCDLEIVRLLHAAGSNPHTLGETYDGKDDQWTCIEIVENKIRKLKKKRDSWTETFTLEDKESLDNYEKICYLLRNPAASNPSTDGPVNNNNNTEGKSLKK